MRYASLTTTRRRREILLGVSGEDFPAFFPPTPVESARNKTPELPSPRRPSAPVPSGSFQFEPPGKEENPMHNKGRFPNALFGVSLRPDSAALAIMILLLFLIFVFLFLTLTTQPALGQTYKVIHNFTGGADGAYPEAGVTMDAAGGPLWDHN
jgi:hypothetical protein